MFGVTINNSNDPTICSDENVVVYIPKLEIERLRIAAKYSAKFSKFSA